MTDIITPADWLYPSANIYPSMPLDEARLAMGFVPSEPPPPSEDEPNPVYSGGVWSNRRYYIGYTGKRVKRVAR